MGVYFFPQCITHLTNLDNLSSTSGAINTSFFLSAHGDKGIVGLSNFVKRVTPQEIGGFVGYVEICGQSLNECQ